MPVLQIRDAHAHNLQHLDLDLPSGRWVALAGPSGSGKSSLAIHILAREGQRRVLAGLSAHARAFLSRTGRAEVGSLAGLPPTVSVGQRSLQPSPRSTVGTLSGLLDLLRLLWARAATSDVPLSRGHFSFNDLERGACPACRGLGVEDFVDPALLVVRPSASIRDGALRPTLASGYTVYSQVTVDVMDRICRAHGFTVDTPWCELSAAQERVVMFGSRVLKVPFGKHSIESRMRWEGITARPREEGYYRGLIPVIEETLQRNRNANILRFVRSVPCSVCLGARLGPVGRSATLAGGTLPALLSTRLSATIPVLDRLPPGPVVDAVVPQLRARLELLVQLGLGHLTLDRGSENLSGGEGQRLRLAAQLGTELSGLLVVLDEPTLGLSTEGIPGLQRALEALRDRGNSLLLVEHDPDMLRRADHVVELGPGAGPAGGEIVWQGAPPATVPTLTVNDSPRTGAEIRLEGATLHALDDVSLRLLRGCLNVLAGPSGAGKSSLLLQTLVPAVGGTAGGPFRSLVGAEELGLHVLDSRPLGRTPRSTPATYTGLFDRVRARFAGTDEARARGWKAGRFSYNNKEGRCEACEGLGVQRVGMHLLLDVERTCEVCAGGRYAADTLEVQWRGRHIAGWLGATVAEAAAVLGDDPELAPVLDALTRLGLGYLRLGQSSTTLSGGEAQRVRLASVLGLARQRPHLVVLDEPDRGLAPSDQERLLQCLHGLVGAGHTVAVISHSRQVQAAADHLVWLRAGQVVGHGPPRLDQLPPAPLGERRDPRPPPRAITLRGVGTHTLRDLTVEVPHDQITAVCGVSGSGKSSLVFDTLAAEGLRRFAEGLPAHARRFLRRLPAPDLQGASGMRTTLVLRQGQPKANRRSTVATQVELAADLRLLWSRAGLLDGSPSGLWAGAFDPGTAGGACPVCEGLGSRRVCTEAGLVTHPDRAVGDGALGGTRPGRFFEEPDGQHLATLRAAAASRGLSLAGPWAALSTEARDLALHGAGEAVFHVTWAFQRGARSGEHSFEGPWPGWIRLVEDEARKRARSKRAAEYQAPLEDAPCVPCGGTRLAAPAREVTVGRYSLGAMLACSVAEARQALAAMTLSGLGASVLEQLRPRLLTVLDDLMELGLGHLGLDRPSPTLSSGERQRLRLAGVLAGGLTGLTLALDEPAAGLHPEEVSGLLGRLRRLRDRGNTVVIVTHRPQLLAAADHVIELGPGPGVDGGQLVFEGSAQELAEADTATGRALRTPAVGASRPSGPVAVRVVGAHLHTLDQVDLALPASGLVVIAGPSGAGKTTLLRDVVGASAIAGAPRGCRHVEGLSGREVHVLGTSVHSPVATPLSQLGLMGPMQAAFAAATGRPKGLFSWIGAAGRCPRCKGAGQERVAMDFLADVALPCPACEGRRFKPEVLEVTWDGRDVHTWLGTPAATLVEELARGPLRDGLARLVAVGLGHLAPGRSCATLSGGEAQRLALAGLLVPSRARRLVLLDEPGRGLHEADLAALVVVLRSLVERGDLLLAVSHRQRLIASADQVVRLRNGRVEPTPAPTRP